MIINKQKNNKGFTLIELLVVVAIISLLSSVVMASLNTARVKAKITAMKQLVQQYRNLLELEISDVGTPNRLFVSVWTPPTTTAQCNSNMPLGSPHRGQAVAICEQLVNLRIHSTGGYNLSVNAGANGIVYAIRSTHSSSPTYYAFCMNSNGEVTDQGTWGAMTPPSQWDHRACGGVN